MTILWVMNTLLLLIPCSGHLFTLPFTSSSFPATLPPVLPPSSLHLTQAHLPSSVMTLYTHSFKSWTHLTVHLIGRPLVCLRRVGETGEVSLISVWSLCSHTGVKGHCFLWTVRTTTHTPEYVLHISCQPLPADCC